MKKHTWKRAWALLMVLAMLFNLSPVTVLAEDPPDPSGSAEEEIIPEETLLPEADLIAPADVSRSENIVSAIQQNGHAYVVSNVDTEVFRDPDMTERLCTVRKSGTVYYADSYGDSVSVWFADESGTVLNGYISPSALENLVIDDASAAGMSEYDPVSASIGSNSVVLFRTVVEYPASAELEAVSDPVPPVVPEEVHAEGTPEETAGEPEPADSAEPAAAEDLPENPEETVPDEDAGGEDVPLPAAEDAGSEDPEPVETPEVLPENPEETVPDEDAGEDDVPLPAADGTDPELPEPAEATEGKSQVPEEPADGEADSAPNSLPESIPAEETLPVSEPETESQDASEPAAESPAGDEAPAIPADASDTQEPEEAVSEPVPDDPEAAEWEEPEASPVEESIPPEDGGMSPAVSSEIVAGGFAEVSENANIYSCSGALCGLAAVRSVVKVENISVNESGETRYLIEYWSDSIDSDRVYAEGYVYAEEVSATSQEDYSLLEIQKLPARRTLRATRGGATGIGYARVAGFSKGRISDANQENAGIIMASGAYLWDSSGDQGIPIYAEDASYHEYEGTLGGFFRIYGTSAKAAIEINPKGVILGQAFSMRPRPVQYIRAYVGDTDRNGVVVQEGDTVTFYSAWTGQELGTALAGEDFEYNDYIFDVWEANAFAERWWNGPEQVNGNDCATFASGYASAGGLGMYSAWASYKGDQSRLYQYPLPKLANYLMAEHAPDPSRFVESGVWTITGDVNDNCTVTVPISCPVETGDIIGVGGTAGDRHHMMACSLAVRNEADGTKTIHLYAHSSGMKEMLRTVTDVIHTSMFAVQYETAPRKGQVELVKKDDAGSAMAGVEFTLSCAALSYRSTKRTDANGAISWTELDPGAYVLDESTPAGYAVNASREIQVTAGNTASVSVVNQRLGSVKLVKKDDSGKVMKDVSFTLSGSGFSSTKKTDANGVIEWAGLKPGAYKLDESTPAGYAVISQINVTVEPLKTTPVNVVNRKLLGSVKVIKKDDSGNTMQGVTFTLSKSPGFSSSKATDAGGIAEWTDLEPGTYVLSEATPVGYEVVSPQNVTVEPDKQTAVNVTNKLIRGNVAVTKYRKQMYDGMTPRPLSGAVLKLCRTGTDTAVGAPIQTGGDGMALWTDIPYGVYDIVEVTAPEGYQSAGIIGTVEVNSPRQTFRRDVTNTPIYGSVAAVKYRKGTTVPLEGAKFELLDSTQQARAVDINGSVTGEKTTDATGVVRWVNIEYGTYYIRETQAPIGYQLDSTPQKVVVETQNDTARFEAADDWISGYIRVVKICEETEDPIPNVEFDILRADGTVADHLTTDANGEATSKALEYGDYTVRETYCPDKYVLNESTFPVSIREHEKTYSLEVTDKANYGWIEVTKLDELDSHPIEGVQFDILRGTDIVGTITTDSAGYAKSGDLVCGDYTVREKSNPTGYVNEIAVTEKTVTPLATSSVTFKNRPIQGKIRIIKSDELTGEALAGAEFTVTRISGLLSHNGEGDGDIVAVIVTGADGIAETGLLTYGRYRVEETVVPEHFKDKNFRAEVSIVTDSKTEEIVYPVDVPNEPTPGWVRLIKTDRVTGNPIPGIAFDVYRYVPGEGQTVWEVTETREFVETIVTDDHGVALSSPLLKGCYYIVEKEATPGYLYEKVEFDGVIVRSDEVTPLTATNFPVQITITVCKRDDDLYKGPIPASPADSLPEAVKVSPPEAHGNAKLTGAEFTVLAEEDILDRQGNVLFRAGETAVSSLVTSGDDASCVTAELFPGKYILKEVKPPEGYKESGTEIHIDASFPALQSEAPVVNYQAVFLNSVKKGRYGLVKFYGDNAIHTDAGILENAEPNATFAVWLTSAGSYENARDDERDILVTNAFGKAKTKELPYGVYTIKQLSGKPGYAVKSPYNFRITGNEDPLDPPIDIINNEAYHYWLKIIKVDENTGKTITLSHAKFKLKDESGSFITQEMHYPQDQEISVFETDDKGSVQLPETLLWGKYYICEIESPEGYLINTEEIEVDVGAEADETYHVEIEVCDTPVLGNIEIDKTGLQLTHFETVQENGYSCEKPIFENQFLAGAMFEVYAAEDIIGKDGTVHYHAGDLADTITTTAEGHDRSKDLPLGKYYVVEKSAPAGYVFSDQRYEADLVYADDHTARVTAQVKAGNDYLRSEVHLEKEQEILTVEEQGDGTIRQIISRIPGEGFIFGLYNAEEIPAPGGTLPAETLLATAVTDASGKLIFSGFYPHGEYYVQELETREGWKLNTGRFRISLTPDLAAEGEKVIRVGLPEKVLNEIVYTPVTITKTDLTEEETIPGALIEVFDKDGKTIYREYTDEDGKIPDIPVTPGKYTFREVLAPEGYALNTAVMTFEVDAEGSITGDTVIHDDFTRVMFTKHDTDGEIMEGVEFTLFDKDKKVVMTARSDKSGLVTFEKIPFGTFTIEETKTLDGYIRKTGPLIMFTVDGTFVNSGKPAGDIRNTPNEIRLKKVDQDGNILPGAEFGLFDRNGTQVMSAVSDESGIVLFRKIPTGEYTVRETKPVEGYLLCKAEYRFTVDDSFRNSPEPAATFVNHLKRIRYIKTDTSGKYLAGVEFSLIDKASGETVETVVSDQNGVFTFTAFDYGDWIIRETKVPEGFNRMEDIELHVGDDWTEPAPFTCVNIPNHYEFLKTDNEGNPMAGVTFTLEDAEGNIFRDLVSGEDGIVHVTDLAPGRYVIRELETLEGFTRSEDAIVVEISEHYVIPEEMFKLVNYPVIQTGVELTTPFLLLGSGLILFASLNGIIWASASWKKRSKKHN